MPRAPQDPGQPRRTVLSTKLGEADAERVIELTSRAGVDKSEWLRSMVLDALERDTGPPDEGG